MAIYFARVCLILLLFLFCLSACGTMVRTDSYRSVVAPVGPEPEWRQEKDDLVDVQLKTENKRYRVANPAWGEATLMRRGLRIFLAPPGKNPRLLWEIDEEWLPPHYRDELSVSIADVNYDGEPEFFILASVGASNHYKVLVDGHGRDIGQSILGEDSPGLFGMPSFYAARKMLETWEKSGPVGAATRYVWKNGRYWMVGRAEPVIASVSEAWKPSAPEEERDLVFHKRLVYDDGALIHDFLTVYGSDDRPLVLTAEEDMPLLAAPVAGTSLPAGTSFPLQGYTGFSWGEVNPESRPRIVGWLKAGESMGVRDIWQEPREELSSFVDWLSLRDSKGRQSGWVRAPWSKNFD